MLAYRLLAEQRLPLRQVLLIGLGLQWNMIIATIPKLNQINLPELS